MLINVRIMEKKSELKDLNIEFKRQISSFSALLDSFPDIIFFKDINGTYIGCNNGLVELLEKSKEDIIGKTDYDLFSEDSAKLYTINDQKVMETNLPHHNEEWITYSNGEKALYETLKAPIYNNNALIGILGICRNITERKELEACLLENKNQLKAILDNLPFMTWLKDDQGRFIAVNEPYSKTCGYSADVLIGKTDLDIWPEELAEMYRKDDFEVMQSRSQKIIEEPIATEEGVKWFEAFKTPIINEKNEVVGTTGVAKDITDRRQTEQELHLKDKLLTAVAKSVNELVKNLNFNEAILNSLEIMGNAANVDRVVVYQNTFDPLTGTYLIGKKFEWTPEGTTVEINNPKLQNILQQGYGIFSTPLLAKKPVIGLTKDFDPKVQLLLKSLNILSLISFPIYVEDYFWGFVGFDDCKTEKIWTEAEQAILSSFSASIASVIERNQKREKEKANEKRISSILNHMRDGIITVNEQCIIESCNPAIELVFGYSFLETIGKNICQLLPYICPNNNNSLLKDLCLYNNESLLKSPETFGMKKDGIYFPAEVNVSEINYDGNIVYLLVIRDITQRKEVDRMKNEFISTVSHELRTPLTSICGSLDLIATGAFGDIPDEVKELLGIASTSSSRLIQLINDILDIEKIEAGKMEFTFEILNLIPVLKQAIEANYSYAQQFNVNLELDTSISDIRVKIDKNRIIQVITNLLSNASKFSLPYSTVKVYVSQHENFVRIAVKDKGTGIPEEFIGKIFQKFAQADSSDSRQKGGTGLGLSICKAIIDRLEGSIDFITSNNGTTFYFDLPVYQDEINLEPTSKNKPKILICEDDKDVAALISHLLKHNGYSTDITYNSEQAKQLLLSKNNYDAATIDLILPGQDGISLIKELRETGIDIPIIVVSIKANEGSEEIDGNFAVVDWIEKPINQSRLLSSIERAIAVKEKEMPHILHIEDDFGVQKVISSVLQSTATVSNANNLNSARKLLENETFDLIILDLSLPDGNGLDILPAINNNNKDIPVIIFSAQDIDENIAKRVDAVLLKSKTTNQDFLHSIKLLIKPYNKNLKI